MSLYENGTPIGGTIFSLTGNKLSIAYRTYQNNWTTAALQANPSAYTEYLLNQEAINQGKEVMIHGKDRNPYGLNSSIGLANFKFAAGCQPELPKKFAVESIDTDTLTTDVLIFALPTAPDTTITKAYLVVDELGVSKWEQLTKYPHLLDVTLLQRKTNTPETT